MAAGVLALLLLALAAGAARRRPTPSRRQHLHRRRRRLESERRCTVNILTGNLLLCTAKANTTARPATRPARWTSTARPCSTSVGLFKSTVTFESPNFTVGDGGGGSARPAARVFPERCVALAPQTDLHGLAGRQRRRDRRRKRSPRRSQANRRSPAKQVAVDADRRPHLRDRDRTATTEPDRGSGSDSPAQPRSVRQRRRHRSRRRPRRHRRWRRQQRRNGGVARQRRRQRGPTACGDPRSSSCSVGLTGGADERQRILAQGQVPGEDRRRLQDHPAGPAEEGQAGDRPARRPRSPRARASSWCCGSSRS